jgi:hypothetical protein
MCAKLKVDRSKEFWCAAGGMAQVVEHLPSRYWAPYHQIKRTFMHSRVLTDSDHVIYILKSKKPSTNG